MDNQAKGVNLHVSHEIVGEIVKAQIGAEVAKALNGADKFVQEMVTQLLSVKTMANGVVSCSSYDNKYTFVDAILGNAIREEAKRIIHKWVSENSHKIGKEIERQLAASTKSIAKSFVSLISGKAQDAFRAEVTVSGVDDKNNIETLFDNLNSLSNRLKKLEMTK